MGWNFPIGNEDIIYFVYTFYNVTANDPSVYAAIRPGMQKILADAGVKFQQLNEQRFGLDIPDGGYTIDNCSPRFGLTSTWPKRGANFASVNVPFALGYAYESKFAGPRAGPSIRRSSDRRSSPGAGFVGVKYLKSPIIRAPTEVGLTLFSNTINGGAFDDASRPRPSSSAISRATSTRRRATLPATPEPAVTKICS